MGPIGWSAVSFLVCVLSVVAVVASVRLWRACRRAGTQEHRAGVTEELTPQISKRPKTLFAWAFGVTFAYWVCMFAFYLLSLGSTQSLDLFFLVWGALTLPAVVISLALTLGFVGAGNGTVSRSRMRGPLVTGIETRAAVMAAGWLGVALFAVLFATAAFRQGL